MPKDEPTKATKEKRKQKCGRMKIGVSLKLKSTRKEGHCITKKEKITRIFDVEIAIMKADN